MKYRTTCPQCTSIFRLGADQLDAAQGWVQCSVCGAAFDARPSLLMEDGSPLPVASEPMETVEAATVEAPAADSMLPAMAAAGEPAPDMAEESGAPTGSEGEPQAAELPIGIAQREELPDLPSIILIDPNIPVTEDYGPLPQMYPPPTPPAPPPDRMRLCIHRQQRSLPPRRSHRRHASNMRPPCPQRLALSRHRAARAPGYGASPAHCCW